MVSDKKSILVVDDEYGVRESFNLVLSDDYEVFLAESGKEATEIFTKNTIDLILLDIQLPTMDGYAVAGELKRNPALADIPIVAVTSYAMVGDRERVLAAGCVGYIEKPINPDTFVDEIEQFLLIRPVNTGDKS